MWGGHTAAEGQIYTGGCVGKMVGAAGWVQVAANVWMMPDQFVANGVPPVNVAAIAEQAISSLTVVEPDPHFGPDTQQAVSRWTYLWITDTAPKQATASAGGVTVTATATLETVDWSIGEPVSLDRPKRLVPTFSCPGTSGDPGPNANAMMTSPKEPGSCAYVYQWRSTAERTNGTGTWPVTATANWTVNWNSDNGVSGQVTLTQAATTQLVVGEWKAEIVAGPR